MVSKMETLEGVTTTFEYGYDLAGRLVAVKQNGIVTENYDYDANGNRVQALTSSPGMVTGSYDDQDRLLEYGGNTYTYTANGELLTKTSYGQTTTYQYDVLGNLRRVVLPGKTIEYVIDGRNRRVGKKVNGTLVQGWLYQGSLKPVAELDGHGNVVARFAYGSKANVPDYLVKEGKSYRILSDHLGSPRLMVDLSNGSVVQRLDYDAFGNVTVDTNPNFQPFGVAGGWYDSDTRLVRFGARDYDAEVGRWTAKDPIKFKGNDTNLYGYVLNEPINRFDKNGLEILTGGISITIPFIGGIDVGVMVVDRDSDPHGLPDVGVYVTTKTNASEVAGADIDYGGTQFQARLAPEITYMWGSREDFDGTGGELSVGLWRLGTDVGLNSDGAPNSIGISGGFNLGLSANATLTSSLTIGDLARGVAELCR